MHDELGEEEQGKHPAALDGVGLIPEVKVLSLSQNTNSDEERGCQGGDQRLNA